MKQLDSMEQAIIINGLNAEIVRMKNMLPKFRSEFAKILEERICVAEQLAQEIKRGELYLTSPQRPSITDLIPFARLQSTARTQSGDRSRR